MIESSITILLPDCREILGVCNTSCIQHQVYQIDCISVDVSCIDTFGVTYTTYLPHCQRHETDCGFLWKIFRYYGTVFF